MTIGLQVLMFVISLSSGLACAALGGSGLLIFIVAVIVSASVGLGVNLVKQIRDNDR